MIWSLREKHTRAPPAVDWPAATKPNVPDRTAIRTAQCCADSKRTHHLFPQVPADFHKALAFQILDIWVCPIFEIEFVRSFPWIRPALKIRYECHGADIQLESWTTSKPHCFLDDNDPDVSVIAWNCCCQSLGVSLYNLQDFKCPQIIKSSSTDAERERLEWFKITIP